MEPVKGYLKKFTIPFSGLKVGTHKFRFQIEQEFFEHFGQQDFENCQIEALLMLEKRENMLELEFTLKGIIQLLCDRCAEALKIPIEDERRMFIKFGPESYEESEDVLVIQENDHELDVSHFIYEFIHLALPAKRVHDEGLCNPDIVVKLEELTPALQVEQEVDPRWAELMKLKKTNKEN